MIDPKDDIFSEEDLELAEKDTLSISDGKPGDKTSTSPDKNPDGDEDEPSKNDDGDGDRAINEDSEDTEGSTEETEEETKEDTEDSQEEYQTQLLELMKDVPEEARAKLLEDIPNHSKLFASLQEKMKSVSEEGDNLRSIINDYQVDEVKSVIEMDSFLDAMDDWCDGEDGRPESNPFRSMGDLMEKANVVSQEQQNLSDKEMDISIQSEFLDIKREDENISDDDLDALKKHAIDGGITLKQAHKIHYELPRVQKAHDEMKTALAKEKKLVSKLKKDPRYVQDTDTAAGTGAVKLTAEESYEQSILGDDPIYGGDYEN